MSSCSNAEDIGLYPSYLLHPHMSSCPSRYWKYNLEMHCGSNANQALRLQPRLSNNQEHSFLLFKDIFASTHFIVVINNVRAHRSNNEIIQVFDRSTTGWILVKIQILLVDQSKTWIISLLSRQHPAEKSCPKNV
ncbi:hypothetical protein KC19_5G022100 [Ceratodon purpureus]|uniref:Uncharacterized protein n=1 Tax=Ceratodon purpureus TaxID=3225 RepID=A0A8T0HY99_CERPU|nr:hypothetical protein KC19_5G022100 [Ceratodon purpureus]